MSERRRMMREARNLGFVDQYSTRPSQHNHGVIEFRAERGDRFLVLQMWSNGKHRVCHGTILGPHREIETTIPTDFETLPQMYRAIAFEWWRASTAPSKPRGAS